MNLKKLRAQKRQLEADARAKMAEITEGMEADAARAIEAEHTRILGEISVLKTKIKAAVAATRAAAQEDTDDDGEDDDDNDDDGDDEGDDTGRRNTKVLTRSHMAELVVIDTQARGLGIDLGLAEAVTRGEKPDAMRKRLFVELAKKSDETAVRGAGNGGSAVIVRDEKEGVKEAMKIALTRRVLASRGNDGIDYAPKNVVEKAHVDKYRKQSDQYMSMGLVDMAAACINYRGTGSYLTARNVEDILTRAFHSTSDFPNIFQNVLNKSLLARYELATPTYRRLAAQRSFKDFRPHPQIRAGEFPGLQPVSETGEIVYGTTSDNQESISVKPYGVIFSISRQMLVNDDLSAIDQILGSAGDTVQVFENTTFFQMFNSNPTLLQDSTAVFAAGHNNLAGTASAISVTSIGAGRAAMRAQKSITGLFLNVPPRYIITGPLKETEADTLVASISPTATTAVNPFSGKLEAISDANITDTSWYLSADPQRVPNFVYGFLNGSNGPRTRTFEPFGVQGVKISLEHDFGVGAVDYRGMYRNAGV